MAKTQDLPLNPAKISGLCNRLLCCLTYEYDSYRAIKREMPKDRQIVSSLKAHVYKVVRVMALQRAGHGCSRGGRRDRPAPRNNGRQPSRYHKGPAKGQAAE